MYLTQQMRSTNPHSPNDLKNLQYYFFIHPLAFTRSQKHNLNYQARNKLYENAPRSVMEDRCRIQFSLSMDISPECLPPNWSQSYGIPSNGHSTAMVWGHYNIPQIFCLHFRGCYFTNGVGYHLRFAKFWIDLHMLSVRFMELRMV